MTKPFCALLALTLCIFLAASAAAQTTSLTFGIVATQDATLRPL